MPALTNTISTITRQARHSTTAFDETLMNKDLQHLLHVNLETLNKEMTYLSRTKPNFVHSLNNRTDIKLLTTMQIIVWIIT